MSKEEERKTKGFFELNESVYIISSNHLEKKQIEDGLNMDIQRIETVKEMITTFTDLTTKDGIRAAFIITDELPTLISRGIDAVKSGLEVADVPVFEIGTGEIVEGAYRFGTIDDFINFARNDRRKAKISEVSDQEQRGILEELQLETEATKEKVTILEEEKQNIEEELEKEKGEKTTLETKIEQVYKVQRDEAVGETQGLKDKQEEVDRLYDIEIKKSEKYREEKDEALNTMVELKLSVASLESALESKQGEVRQYQRELESKEKALEKEVREKDKIIKSKVDSEDHVILSDELQLSREEIKDLERKLVTLQIKEKKTQIEKEMVEKENRSLQDGEINIKEFGRTMKLDTYKFEKVELIYIKVFESMPYLRKSIQMFFDKLSKRVEGRSHMMILRHDDGLDSDYFEGIPLWSKLKDVPSEDRVFRLFPNPSMFSRLDDWEKDVKLLVVVDNIKNNEYYLQSKSRERVMTVVRRESDLEKYMLKGRAITIEGSSIFDVSEDSKIQNTGMKANRDRLLGVKVDKWVNDVMD